MNYVDGTVGNLLHANEAFAQEELTLRHAVRDALTLRHCQNLSRLAASALDWLERNARIDMRQIVPDEMEERAAILRGERAVFDLDLYNRIFQIHYLDAFHAWCKERHLDFSTENPEGTEFDAAAYVKKNLARRNGLNRFIKGKPFIIVLDDRFFIITFLSEIELRIDELTPQEIADMVNVLREHQGFFATIKSWFRGIN